MVKDGYYDTDLEVWNKYCNVPLSHYRDHITDVQVWEFENMVVVVKNEDELKKAKEEYDYPTDAAMATIFSDTVEDVTVEALSIVHQQDPAAQQIPDAYVDSDWRGEHYYCLWFGICEVKKGLFYEKAGYQRKGVTNRFYEHFRQFEYWGKREDFELAYECVGGEWYLTHLGTESVQRMRDDFKSNFLDNFEDGRSLLHPSF